MSTNHNRIKVADLETNQPNKILKTNQNGELEFSNISDLQTESYNALDCTTEGKILDARQGKVLKEMIDNKESVSLVNDLTTGGTTKALTAEMGKQLNEEKLTATIATLAETQITSFIPEDNKVVSRSKLYSWGGWFKTTTQVISAIWNFTNGFNVGSGSRNIRVDVNGIAITGQTGLTNWFVATDNVLKTAWYGHDFIKWQGGNYTTTLQAPVGLDQNPVIKMPQKSGTIALINDFVKTAPGMTTTPSLIIPNGILTTIPQNGAIERDSNGELWETHDGVRSKLFFNNPVSATDKGLVNNTELQELGGADKTLNGVRIGKGAGNEVTNTVLGNSSLDSNTTGFKNTAVGTYSLQNNTLASYNTAIGYYSLNKNTTGTNNTAIGESTLCTNTRGANNVAIGSNSLNNTISGSCNTAIGNNSLYNNTTANFNTAIGYNTLNNSTTGIENTAIGSNSLYYNKLGVGNTAVGTNALYSNTAANYNTAIGYSSLNTNSVGTYNIAIGYCSGYGITTGNNNTIIGGGNTITYAPNDSKLVILADGTGNIALRKEADNRLLAPTLSQSLIISGGSKSLINKEFADNMGAVVNTTIIPLANSNLTSTYPNALLGFRVHCNSITTGGLIYEKTSNGWLQYAATVVV